MKTKINSNNLPVLQDNPNQNDVNDYLNNVESEQVNPQQSVENEDSDNWYNESSI